MYELNSIALRASYSMIFADDVNKYPANNLWSAICFKIMTRYTRGFFPTYSCNHSCYMIYVRFFVTYTCVFLLCGYKRAYTCAQKKSIYMRYKQACGIWGHRKSSYKRHRIIPSAKNPFMYDGAEK